MVYAADDNGSARARSERAPTRASRPTEDGRLPARRLGPRPGTGWRPADGGGARTLLAAWQRIVLFAFSPDSTTVAALSGPEIGKKLVLIDVASGEQRTIANGFFSGFSFSPDGGRLAFSKAGNENYPPRSDVYRFPTGRRQDDPAHPRPELGDPLWGPTGRSSSSSCSATRAQVRPQDELFLMNTNGQGVKRLTHTQVDPLL